MNQFMRANEVFLREALDSRFAIVKLLNESDLNLCLPGNPSLGQLVSQFADLERAYTAAFKGLELRIPATNPKPYSLEELRNRFVAQGWEIITALLACTDERINTLVEGTNPRRSLAQCAMALRDQTLIFIGKASVYLSALERPLPISVEP